MQYVDTYVVYLLKISVKENYISKELASVSAAEVVETVSSTGQNCCTKFPGAVRILEARDRIRCQI